MARNREKKWNNSTLSNQIHISARVSFNTFKLCQKDLS
jgi:hypothetical protein